MNDSANCSANYLANFLALAREAWLTMPRLISVVVLAALPITLLWPYWKQSLPEELTRHLISAIYEFPSDDMPRCEQFIRHTHTGASVGQVACESHLGQLMI